MSITAWVVGMVAAVCIMVGIGLVVTIPAGAGFLLGVGVGIVCALLAHVGLDR